MQAPLIQGLNAELVPHHQFATRRWFYANPLWYYHRPGPLPRLNLQDEGFYRLIDPELREICQLLHRSAILTTPSCQGHFHARNYFRPVWEELKREEELIRTLGLTVTDCETAEAFTFRDAGYQLPWRSLAQFHEQVAPQQHVGYLGIVIPVQREALRRHLHGDAYATGSSTIMLDEGQGPGVGGALFAATVSPATPDQRRRQWQHIHDYLHTLLRQHPSA